ncbi:hypothetical protein D3C77_198590 [compost metagenome]
MNNWTGSGVWEGWSIEGDELISPTGRAYKHFDIEPEYYTQSDLARLLGVTRGAIADRMRRGTLPPYDKDKTWRYDTIKHLL